MSSYYPMASNRFKTILAAFRRPPSKLYLNKINNQSNSIEDGFGNLSRHNLSLKVHRCVTITCSKLSLVWEFPTLTMTKETNYIYFLEKRMPLSTNWNRNRFRRFKSRSAAASIRGLNESPSCDRKPWWGHYWW